MSIITFSANRMNDHMSSTPTSSSLDGVVPSVALTSLTEYGNNKLIVGSAWVITSAILTTYSTTRFLKYRGKDSRLHYPEPDGGSELSVHRFGELFNSRSQTQIKQAEKEEKATAGRLSRASLLTLYRFSGSLILGLTLHSQFHQLSKFLPRLQQTIKTAEEFILPSLFLFAANYSNSIALDRIGISLCYTSKCGINLITVLFTLILDGVSALPSAMTLASLVPIAFGIGMASWNSPTFEWIGFLAAMLSATSQAALNVSSKRVMNRTGVKGSEAQRSMVLVALCICLIMTGSNSAIEKIRVWRSSADGSRDDGEVSVVDDLLPPHPPLWLTTLAVVAYHFEYVLSFCFVGLVEPITYGTCDALRRLLIIISGQKMFGGNPLSKTNVGGIFVTLFGALTYSITSAGGNGSAIHKAI